MVCFVYAAIREVIFICAKGGKFAPVGGTRKGLSSPFLIISLYHFHELQGMTLPTIIR